MQGPAPTTGQVWAGHFFVGAVSAGASHLVMSDTKLKPNTKIVVLILSAVGGAYAHHKFDVPVAQALAKLAA
ncbi:MAG TPA: hypothetical protein VND89_01665 [Acidimicrobiales bacterium]|nr:hypothetical protein [Acidimicrobiales bacterium]